MIRSLLFVAFIFTSVAYAQDEAMPASGSEYLHQAAGRHFELSPGTGVQSTTAKYKNSTTKEAKRTLIPLTATAEYGFTDLFSLGLKVGVGVGATDLSCDSTTLCNDTVHSGMIDPTLSANFRIPVGAAALRFGADLSTSIGKYKIENDGDTNLASGGTKLTPYAGVEFLLADMVFGTRLSYDLYKGDREVEDQTTNPTSNYKYIDKRELNAAFFYEFNFPRIVSIGGALEYINSPTSKTESNGVKTSDKNAADIYALKAYVPLRFNPRVTLVPSLKVGVVDYKDTTNIKSQALTELNVFARFTF